MAEVDAYQVEVILGQAVARLGFGARPLSAGTTAQKVSGASAAQPLIVAARAIALLRVLACAERGGGEGVVRGDGVRRYGQGRVQAYGLGAARLSPRASSCTGIQSSLNEEPASPSIAYLPRSE